MHDSGCARCVYDIYAEDLTEYQRELLEAREALVAKGVAQSEWPVDLQPKAPVAAKLPMGAAQVDETVKESLAEQQAEDEVVLNIQGLSVSMKAFLKLERDLRKRRKAKEAVKAVRADVGAGESTASDGARLLV